MIRDWEIVRIEDIAQHIAVGPFGSSIKAENFVMRGVPLIRGVNLPLVGFSTDGFVFLTEELADHHRNSNVVAGDIVFTWKGTLGQVGIVPDGPFDRYVIASNQMKLTCDPRVAEPRYIYYFFRSSRGQQSLLMNASQTGVPAISRPVTSLKSVELPLPPIEEQRRIAHILGTLDDKIELNRQMNQTLDEIARTLFRSWFVDFDPVRAKAEGRRPDGMDAETAALFPDCLVDSELGPIPEGWDVGRLDDLLILQRGFDLPTALRSEGAYPVISAGGPSGTHSDFKAKGPGVVTGRSGVIGRVFYTSSDFWPLNTSLWVKEFRHSRPLFAFYLLQKLELDRYQTGSAVPTLNRNHVHGLLIPRPPVTAIEAFERIAEPLRMLMESNLHESHTLAETRDELLPELLSGRQWLQALNAKGCMEDGSYLPASQGLPDIYRRSNWIEEDKDVP